MWRRWSRRRKLSKRQKIFHQEAGGSHFKSPASARLSISTKAMVPFHPNKDQRLPIHRIKSLSLVYIRFHCYGTAEIATLRPGDQAQLVRLHQARMCGHDADAETVGAAFGRGDAALVNVGAVVIAVAA